MWTTCHGFEVDTKKSLLYLSLRQEATNIFHQKNPTEMSKCTTDAFVEQLKETLKKLKNETFVDINFLMANKNTTSH